MKKVLIFNEFKHEKILGNKSNEVYPNGIHTTLKDALKDEFEVDCVTLENIEEITAEKLSETDVLIWWGHIAHNAVPDDIAELVHQAVLEGMGFIVLHSGHHSKPFKLLMGTNCNLTWRENEDRELLWVCKPSHPIAQGIGRFIYIEHEETYGEPFSVPEPDETVFIGNYEGGEVFRAGLCWQRENGRIFYFQPGHETFPTFYNPDVIKVIKNAINWAAPVYRIKIDAPNVAKPGESKK